jgi:alkyl hydroperoxide reductase 1
VSLLPSNNTRSSWRTQPLIHTCSPPGAFTPVCSAAHVPGYIENLPKLKAKGVDAIAVLAYNDAYVMSAWGKANGVKGDDIVSLKFLSPFLYITR